jgi:hypothetical protein
VHLATFSNDIVNAIKVVFGDTLPIEVCALENNKKTVQLQQGSQLYPKFFVRRIPNYCRRNKRTKDIGLHPT